MFERRWWISWVSAAALAGLVGCGDATRDETYGYEADEGEDDEAQYEIEQRPGEITGPQEFPDPNLETDGFGPVGDHGSFVEHEREGERARDALEPEDP